MPRYLSERNLPRGATAPGRRRRALSCVAATLVAGCSANPAAVGPTVADALPQPQDQELVLRAFATGVQVYECAEGKSGPAWASSDTRADLADENGRRIGRHYGGSTWEAADGSKVVARPVVSVDSALAAPLLLLASRSNHGDGVFSRVRSIQRLQTAGGGTPREACRADAIGRRIESPYTAVYYFYSDSPFATRAADAAWNYSAISSRAGSMLMQAR